MSNDRIVVRKRRPHSSVPDDVLEDIRLSMRARLVLGWMLGRPDGWVIRIAHMMKVLGMSEHIWAAIRNELQQVGYYRQTRIRLETGRFVWEKEVIDPPEPPSPKVSGMVATTPGAARHGGSMPDAFRPDATMPDAFGDIPPSSKQDQLPPPPTSSKKHAQSKSTPQSVVVVELDELVESACWQALKADKQITNRSAWRASVRKRIQENGPSQEDQLCLEEWRAFLKAQERRQAEDAEKAAKEAQPVANREVAMAHLRDLKRPFGRSRSSQENLDNGETTVNQPQDDGETP
jgi:hypothetical protein